MERTIFIGDVHGCRDELDALLDAVGFARGDRVVLVGDLVVRGPDPRGTLDLVRKTGAVAVRGNHEDRLLRHRQSPSNNPLGELSLATVRALRKRDWALLEALPLWLDVPEHMVRVIHAGLAPGVPIERQDPRVLMHARWLDEDGVPTDTQGHRLWGEAYTGPPHMIFGHHARKEPQLHEWATGLDTGCVYGGMLTAMVLPRGEAPPAAAERRSVLVSVRARRCYVSPR